MRELTNDELDIVSGGDDNYKECTNGTTAGGRPGLYPNYIECNGTRNEMIMSSALTGAAAGAAGGAGGRPS